MLDQETLKKIRSIQIRTKRALKGIAAGEHRTPAKGFGMEFDQLREYQFGEDFRFIDWKSSARMNSLLLKQYVDERKRTLMLVVDVSGSSYFGSQRILKSNLIAEAAAAIALAGQQEKDDVGLILVADDVELVIPPRSGKKHIGTIINTLFTHKNTHKETRLSSAFQYLAKRSFPDAMIFILSDFIDESFKDSLRALTKRHDVLALRCLDKIESTMPSIGYLRSRDIEDGESVFLKAGNEFKQWQEKRKQKQNKLFRSLGIDYCDLIPSESFLDTLIHFLRTRTMKR